MSRLVHWDKMIFFFSRISVSVNSRDRLRLEIGSAREQPRVRELMFFFFFNLCQRVDHWPLLHFRRRVFTFSTSVSLSVRGNVPPQLGVCAPEPERLPGSDTAERLAL